MLELALRVPVEASEDVLDGLLLIAPHGVLEIERGDEIELRVRGGHGEMPAADAVEATAARWPHSLVARELPDDWQARRLLDYEPRVVGARFAVRPSWAPPSGDGLIDLALEESDAFGGGGHPTTWACLERLCALDSEGSFADLGCGSGLLAIAAALLGFEDVAAVDFSATAVAAARANAERNGVVVRVEALDLGSAAPPPARTVMANVPAPVHQAIAVRLSAKTEIVVASGVLESNADEVAASYGAAGLTEVDRRAASGWAVLTLVRVRGASMP